MPLPDEDVVLVAMSARRTIMDLLQLEDVKRATSSRAQKGICVLTNIAVRAK